MLPDHIVNDIRDHSVAIHDFPPPQSGSRSDGRRFATSGPLLNPAGTILPPPRRSDWLPDGLCCPPIASTRRQVVQRADARAACAEAALADGMLSLRQFARWGSSLVVSSATMLSTRPFPVRSHRASNDGPESLR